MKKIIYILVAVFAVFILCTVLFTKKGESNMTNDKTLIAYFSATGTTANVAQKLSATINADLFEIKPEQPYTDADLNWRNDKSRSSVEMADKNSRPKIASHIDDISQYKTVFVGFPIWWGREPSIVDTFLESYDFTDKTIIPFATSGSTPSTDEAATSMQSIIPNAHVLTGKRFPANVTEPELKTWAEELLK